MRPRTGSTLPSGHGSIPTGFPSPAEDYLEARLEIAGLVEQNPVATYYLHYKGPSFPIARIQTGDILVVDRSKKPSPGCVVVVADDEGFHAAKLVRVGREMHLEFADGSLRSANDQELGGTIWGMVTFLIARLSDESHNPCSR